MKRVFNSACVLKCTEIWAPFWSAVVAESTVMLQHQFRRAEEDNRKRIGKAEKRAEEDQDWTVLYSTWKLMQSEG